MSILIRMRMMPTPNSALLPDGQTSHRLNEHCTRNDPDLRPHRDHRARQHPTGHVFTPKPLGRFAIVTITGPSVKPQPKNFSQQPIRGNPTREFAENFFG
jgi:hypothetical protein